MTTINSVAKCAQLLAGTPWDGFDLFVAEITATEILVAERGIKEEDLEDNFVRSRIEHEAYGFVDAAIIEIRSHPEYHPADPDFWDRVLDGVRKAVVPAVGVNAQVHSTTGPEWDKDGRASDVPATKLDLSKTLFPVEGDDYYAEHGKSAKDGKLIDFADVKAATLRSLDFIIPLLLPGGKRQGGEWVVRNPTRQDSKPGSFSVNMRTGVWSDFATGDSGGDMIDLYVYINGGSNLQAKNALADMLNVQARLGSTSSAQEIPSSRSAVVTAAPGDLQEPPKAFPPRTPPDKDGKPAFVVAGDEGPSARNNELRRHIYRQGGVAVRIKIIKKDKKGALNVYRVIGADGVTGWQYAKPQGFHPIPYFIPSADPFFAVINQPIFWTEGERDVETVVALGGFAFTFGGCGDGLPSGCEQYAVGRPVIILADNDDEGRKHAEEKASRISSVATIVKIVHFRELEDKADVSDWAAIASNTLVELMTRVKSTEPWQPPAEPKNPTNKLPYGYAFSDRGLMWKDPDDAEKSAMHIAGHFDIEAMTRDADGNSWGLLLYWKDPDGRDHRFALARSLLAGDGSEARRILTDQGLFIAPGQGARGKFNAFLLQVTSPNRALATDRVGWNGTAFVLPDECFGGKPGETHLLQNATSHEHLFRQAGTLEEWQEIPKLAVGNSRLIFAISAAFAGPLLDPCKEEGGGVHLKGSSSIGKTTALHAAGSVWGGNGKNTGFTQTWRATANGLEGICVNHNDTLLPLDEMAQVTPKDAGEAIYMMTNGAGKARSRTDGTARKSAKFRVMLLSSGEIALADKIAEDGRGKLTAGQQVRVVDVPADAGAGLGLFENLHGFESGKALSKHIVATATTRFYGTAGRAFLTAIMPQLDDIRRQAAEVIPAFCKAYLPTGADGQVGRVAQRFALIAFAGELAIRLGVIRVWEDGTAIAAAGVCFEAWLKERGHQGAAEAHGGIEAVRAFLQMHGMARFVDAWGEEDQAAEHEEWVRISREAGARAPSPLRPPNPQRDACGFRRRCGSAWEFFITEAGWAEICTGFNPKTLAKTLIDMKALFPDTDGRAKRQERIPGHGKARYYYILSSFLQEE